MVAILVASILGAGLSTLFLAHFGFWIAILAVPLAGSVAGITAALCLAAARDRYRRNRIVDAGPDARPFAIAR